MSLLIPLGLLGLLSVIALILIYIIKPNFQQKRVSSTYVWKLSLKYKKKRIPVSRLSQILIFICQLIILVLCALMLAKPAILEERVDYKTESVVIIDASASMMVSEDGESRFDRAVAEVKEFADNVMSSDGVLSIIIADYNAYFLTQRSSASDALVVAEEIEKLEAAGISKCTYGSADMEGAIELAEQVLNQNNNAKIYLYTATKYIEKNGIEVISVAKDDEWNAAILDCTATMEDDNFYSISINVGCYGKSENITVHCDINGVNGKEKESVDVTKTVFLDTFNQEETIKLTTTDFAGRGIYSFKDLHVYIEVNDGFEFDNTFDYYGGQRETIKIQYASSVPNNFFKTVCRVLRTQLRSKWDIEYKFVTYNGNDTNDDKQEKPATEGFDLYIYEHAMPSTLPTDGVVLLINPNKAPLGSGLRLGDSVRVSKDSTLGLGIEHDITKYVDTDNITISSYRKIISADGYENLLYYANEPVMLVKNERKAKIVVCSFNLNFSNVGIIKEFPMMIFNLFNYFIPTTITGHSFEIGDTIELNARGEDLTVSTSDGKATSFYELPAEYRVDSPGTYTLTQYGMDDKMIVENFFVKVPNFESNITKEVAELPQLHITIKQEYADKDLLVYFAAAMFALLFIEWLLQAREYFR